MNNKKKVYFFNRGVVIQLVTLLPQSSRVGSCNSVPVLWARSWHVLPIFAPPSFCSLKHGVWATNQIKLTLV